MSETEPSHEGDAPPGPERSVARAIKGFERAIVISLIAMMMIVVIAIARKVIVLDSEKYDGLEVLAVAALVLSLAGGLFAARRVRDRGASS